MQHEVIVIGGGIAGLQCARELHQAGRQVLVLERARGVGGRLATRRYEGQPIDFGPMFLHGHHPAFLAALRSTEGVIFPSTWPRHIQGHGQPCQPNAFEGDERRAIFSAGLNAFAKHLATGLTIQLGTSVKRITLDAAGFTLETKTGETFQCRELVVALALEQALALLATLPTQPELTSIQALLGMFASVPSLTLLAAYPPQTTAPEWDLLYPDQSDSLQLIAQDSRKRQHPNFLTLVIQAKPGWSAQRLDLPPEVWSAELLRLAAEQAGEWVLEPLWTAAHRWRFARVDRGNELARPILATLKHGPRLGLAGDVFSPGGGVQAAWLSGSALAQRMLNEVRL
ncbi:MAG: FAD-dependent oxidoreductase [Holophaga sp.]|nr:FAD-dependent oxidoreductase [Holophaga sp.]